MMAKPSAPVLGPRSDVMPSMAGHQKREILDALGYL